MEDEGAFPRFESSATPYYPLRNVMEATSSKGEPPAEEQVIFEETSFKASVHFDDVPAIERGSDDSWSDGDLDRDQLEEDVGAEGAAEFTFHDRDDSEYHHEDDDENDSLGMKGVEDVDDTKASVCTEDDISTAEGPLLWRMDPKNSWSDWTIVVVTNEQDGQTLYHVHKALLASGPRRSRYFRRLFRTDEIATDQASKKCQIELPLLSARAFPLFLDLIYDQGLSVHHTDQGIKRHVVALYQLADTFQVSDLLREIRSHFIPKIDLSDACRYYQDAVAFDPPVQSFLDHIMKVCTTNVLAIQPSSPLLKTLEPDFLMGILETERRRRETRVTAGAEALHVSRHLSKLIVSYVAHLEAEHMSLDDRTLELLTRNEYIPSIDFGVVLDWSQIVIPKIRQEIPEELPPSKDAALNLQLRCLESIKGNIDKVDLDDPDSEYRDFLKSLPAETAVDAVLELTSLRQRAQQDLMETKYERLWKRNAELESAQRENAAEIQTLTVERDECRRELGRFELVSPAVGKKSSLKKVTAAPENVPRGVRAAEGSHLQCGGRPLFTLRPKSRSSSAI